MGFGALIIGVFFMAIGWMVSSRLKNKFRKYSQTHLTKDLTGADIAKLMLAGQNYRFSPEGEKAFGEYIRLRMKLEHFANARSIRNALDRARLRQANRLFEGAKKSLSRTDLMTIEAEDIRASRVFKEGASDLDGDEGANNVLVDQPPAVSAS